MGVLVLCSILSVVFFARPSTLAPLSCVFTMQCFTGGSVVRNGDDHLSELPANESSLCVSNLNRESLAEKLDGTDLLIVGKSPNPSTKESSLCSAFCSAVHPHIFSSSRLSPSRRPAIPPFIRKRLWNVILYWGASTSFSRSWTSIEISLSCLKSTSWSDPSGALVVDFPCTCGGGIAMLDRPLALMNKSLISAFGGVASNFVTPLRAFGDNLVAVVGSLIPSLKFSKL